MDIEVVIGKEVIRLLLQPTEDQIAIKIGPQMDVVDHDMAIKFVTGKTMVKEIHGDIALIMVGVVLDIYITKEMLSMTSLKNATRTQILDLLLDLLLVDLLLDQLQDLLQTQLLDQLPVQDQVQVLDQSKSYTRTIHVLEMTENIFSLIKQNGFQFLEILELEPK